MYQEAFRHIKNLNLQTELLEACDWSEEALTKLLQRANEAIFEINKTVKQMVEGAIKCDDVQEIYNLNDSKNKINLFDGAEADRTFSILMGDQVEPRRNFIDKNAKYVKELDI